MLFIFKSRSLDEESCLRVGVTSTVISRLVPQENAAKGEIGPPIHANIYDMG